MFGEKLALTGPSSRPVPLTGRPVAVWEREFNLNSRSRGTGSLSKGCDRTVYLGSDFLPLGEPIGLPIDESLGHESLSGGAVRTREPWI